MPRMRSIKPEFWADQDLTRLRRDLRLLYVALWNFTDEEARMQGDPRLVKSWCFPLDDDLTAADIDGWLDELADAGKVIRYEVDGCHYLFLPKLAEHQKLDPRLTSRLPAPPRTDSSVRTGVETPTAHRPEIAKHVAGGREHGAGGARAVRDATPPRSTCGKHPNGSEKPCGACADARRRRTEWDAAEPERKRRAVAERRAAIDACDSCDVDGWLLDDNGDPSALHCDHRPIPVSLLHDTSRSAHGRGRR